MDYYNNNYLQHFGVKGMKWGVRRNKNSAVNKSYTAKQRKQDRAFYGKGGEKRINKKLNQGHGLRGARHYEAERKEKIAKAKKTVKKGAKKAAKILGTVGTYYVYDQAFYGGRGTKAVKDTVKFAGRAAVTAALHATGSQKVEWYN